MYVTEVVVDNFSLLEPKSNNAGSGQSMNSNNSNNYSQSNNMNNSFGNQNNQQNSVGEDPFANNGEPIDISDDELPF